MTGDTDPLSLPVDELARRIAARELSPVEAVDASLARIAEVQPVLRCFTGDSLERWADDARRRARDAADAVVRGSPLGALHGVPVAIKETTPIAGHPHTSGSLTQRDVIATRDGAVVPSLRAAGAIVVGVTTSPEFAHHSITDSPLWGATGNPWAPALTPGGSSGGSAAAVASGCVRLAEGSDMGGSVRIPASWCGIVGLKPGIGRIPMDALPGLYDSLSHHGPLARSVDDARRFLAVTQGPDEADVMSLTTPLDLDGPSPSDVRGWRLALSVDLGGWWVDPEIRAAVERAAGLLEAAGAVVEPVDLQLTPDDEWVWIQLWGVFMSGYYGDLLAGHRAELDPDVVRLIELGDSLSATQVKRLELQRTDLWHRVRRALDGRRALLCPTMAARPESARKADRRPPPREREGRWFSSEMTGLFNLVAPCPALSVPCGFHAADPAAGIGELPIGLQVVGRRWREDEVLRIGRAVELALPEVTARRPPWPPALSPSPSPSR